MRKAICIICGRPATVINMCEDHYSQRNELFSLPTKLILLKACDTCDAVFDQRWINEGIENGVANILTRAMKTHGKIEKLSTKLEKIGENFMAKISASGTIPPLNAVKTEERFVKVQIKRIKCPSCVKLSGHYHEAVVQVRGERMQQIIEIIDEATPQTPKRIERIKEGLNIYFVHKGDARAAISALKWKLKREREPEPNVIRSHKTVGQKQGENLMRDFYAVR